MVWCLSRAKCGRVERPGSVPGERGRRNLFSDSFFGIAEASELFRGVDING